MTLHVTEIADGRRDVARWGKPVFAYRSMDEMLGSDLSRGGIHSARMREHYIDILVVNRSAKTTIVSFHPSLTPGRPVKLPVFVGQGVADLDANLVMVSDPALYCSEAMLLGWFAGTAEIRLQELLPAVLRKASDDLGGNRLIFTGVSGGGFATLFYGRLFPGSLAVPVNPQTSIAAFGRAAAAAYVRDCFGASADVENVLKTAIRSNLIEEYRSGFDNYIIYLQNALDHHLGLHAEPFFDALPPGSDARATMILGHSWGPGHTAAPAPFIKAVLAAAVSAESFSSLVSAAPALAPEA